MIDGVSTGEQWGETRTPCLSTTPLLVLQWLLAGTTTWWCNCTWMTCSRQEYSISHGCLPAGACSTLDQGGTTAS